MESPRWFDWAVASAIAATMVAAVVLVAWASIDVATVPGPLVVVGFVGLGCWLGIIVQHAAREYKRWWQA